MFTPEERAALPQMGVDPKAAAEMATRRIPLPREERLILQGGPGKAPEGLQVFFPGLLDDIRGKLGSGRPLGPVQGEEIISQELLVKA